MHILRVHGRPLPLIKRNKLLSVVFFLQIHHLQLLLTACRPIIQVNIPLFIPSINKYLVLRSQYRVLCVEVLIKNRRLLVFVFWFIHILLLGRLTTLIQLILPAFIYALLVLLIWSQLCSIMVPLQLFLAQKFYFLLRFSFCLRFRLI